MVVGCYVIGETAIHLTPPIADKRYYSIDGCVQYFAAACKNLPGKLECIVIVEPDVTEPKILRKIFDIAQEYANSVYIIPAIVAILEYSVSMIKNFNFDKILMLLRATKDSYYACSLTRENNLIYPFFVKTENAESLRNNFCSGFLFKDVYCVHQYGMGINCMMLLKLQFPTINFLQLGPPLTTLAMGGFCKAQCIAEPGKYLEVLNFTPGIYNGNVEIVKRCSTFPLELPYMPMIGVPTFFRDILTINESKKQWKIKEYEIILPPQISVKNYLIEYNKFGLLTFKDSSIAKQQLSFSIFKDFIFHQNKIHVWSIEKQVRVVFDLVQQKQYFDPFDDYVKNLISVEWLNSLGQSIEAFPTPASDLHTVLADKNIYNYINGPLISITPSYIGILQYYITYYKPTTQNLIFFIFTENCSKYFALVQRSPLCYTVTYISDYYENQKSFDVNSVKKETRVFYIYGKGMNPILSINSLFTSVTSCEISDLQEIMYYGGAIYALQNSHSTLISPYVTFDPLLVPEENNCDGLSTVSRKTLTYFYEIEAFFHRALKFINTNLFYGDLIAIILQIKEQIYIFFFSHIESKFLFKFYISVSVKTIIDDDLLHFADYVIVESTFGGNLETLRAAKNAFVTFLKRGKTSGINEFLKDMMDEKLLIYDTIDYSKAITKVRSNRILKSVFPEMTIMTVEYKMDRCRIIFGNDNCISVDGEEWIPMYISFLQAIPKFGTEAIKDSENYPESAIYDFVKLIGITSKTLTTLDPKRKFQLVEMDESKDPKIGFKVKTIDGYKIISPEMALRIYLQYLVKIYEKYIGISFNKIKIRLIDTVLTSSKKKAFRNIAKQSHRVLGFCR